jgi:hypothetical protein
MKWEFEVRKTGFGLCGMLCSMVLAAAAHAQVPCLSVNGISSSKIEIMSDVPIQAEVQESISFHPGTGKQEARKMGRIVRDSAGRLRIETDIREGDQDANATLQFPDGSRAQVPRNYLAATIWIYDRTQFQRIELSPGRLRAETSPFYAAASGDPDIKLVCSDKNPQFRNYEINHAASRITQEVLGMRNIEGHQALGVKQTTYRQQGQDWQAIRETLFWYSTEFGIELRRIEKDLQTGMERQIEVISIERKEPEISQFAIPAGYHINPPAAENPRIIEDPNP